MTIAITAHWIDKNWKLHEALLDFKRLLGSHTGNHLAKEIFETLDAFNLTEKLLCITTDNASNNKKAMKALSKLLKKWKKITWNWKECHISCLNHVLDLGVQAFLKSIKILDEEVEEEVLEDEEEVDDTMDEDTDEDENEDDDEDEDEEVTNTVAQAASEFQAIMQKLCEIVKV